MHSTRFCPSSDADTLARRIVVALSSGDDASAQESAVELSQYFASIFPHIPESSLLYAVSLSRKHPQAALKAWDTVLRRNPLQLEWLAQALRLAWQVQDVTYAARWTALLNHVFLTPPPVSLLVELEASGWNELGAVGIHNGQLRGWTWQTLNVDDGLPRFTAESAKTPALQVTFTQRLKTADRVLNVFSLNLPDVAGSYAVRVESTDGRQACGSPAMVSVIAPRKSQGGQASSVAMIIPVFADRRAALACIGSVLASRKHNRTPFELVVVWDCGPDTRLHADLQRLAARGKCTLHMLPYNMGFLGAVNFALERHPKQTALLLNADTLVCNDWLDRLHRAGSQRGVGTVTPFGTHAELLSFPTPQEKFSVTKLSQVRRLDAACRSANADDAVKNIPVGVGFCMYISQTALDRVGGLDGRKLFRGYGEEVDFCLHVRDAGLRNVAACNVFVGHVGERSFGAGKLALAIQNNIGLFTNYPDYRAEYNNFVAVDPLRRLRERAGWLALEPMNGPLHLGTILDGASPELLYLDECETMSAILLFQPCGERTRAMLRVRCNLPLPDMHFVLPRDFSSLSYLLTRLAPARIVAHSSTLRNNAILARLGLFPVLAESPRMDIPDTILGAAQGTWITPAPRSLAEWQILCRVARQTQVHGHTFKVLQLDTFWKGAPCPLNVWPAPEADSLSLAADGLLLFGTAFTPAWQRWAEEHGLAAFRVRHASAETREVLCA